MFNRSIKTQRINSWHLIATMYKKDNPISEQYVYMMKMKKVHLIFFKTYQSKIISYQNEEDAYQDLVKRLRILSKKFNINLNYPFWRKHKI